MMSLRGVAVVLVAALVGVGTASGQERKIKRSDLPPAVERAVAAQSQGAAIRGFSQETENGQTYYEVEMTVAGRGKDVLMDANGAVVEVEEQVAPDALPAAVSAGLSAKAGRGNSARERSLG